MANRGKRPAENANGENGGWVSWPFGFVGAGVYQPGVVGVFGIQFVNPSVLEVPPDVIHVRHDPAVDAVADKAYASPLPLLSQCGFQRGAVVHRGFFEDAQK
jgi:hypothetical protein